MLAKICIFLVLLACRQGATKGRQRFTGMRIPSPLLSNSGPSSSSLPLRRPYASDAVPVANLGAGFNSSTTKVTLFQNRVFITKGTHDTRRTGHACCRHMPLYMCMQQAKPQEK